MASNAEWSKPTSWKKWPPVILRREDPPPFLKDHTAYLVTELQPGPDITIGTADPELGIVEVPSPPLPRFLPMTGPGGDRCIVFLDDVIRFNLPRVFPERVVAGAYAIKVSRDAELYLDDEFDTGLRKAIKKSLRKRETGAPIRFLYDMLSPHAMVTRLTTLFDLRGGDLIEGGGVTTTSTTWPGSQWATFRTWSFPRWRLFATPRWSVVGRSWI